MHGVFAPALAPRRQTGQGERHGKKSGNQRRNAALPRGEPGDHTERGQSKGEKNR